LYSASETMLGTGPSRKGAEGDKIVSLHLIVPQSAKCLNSKMVKHCALTIVNSDRGFESWPGYEVKPPDCHSSLEAHDPVIVPRSAKCLNSKMVKHCALTDRDGVCGVSIGTRLTQQLSRCYSGLLDQGKQVSRGGYEHL
jgi:hypothetical protein